MPLPVPSKVKLVGLPLNWVLRDPGTGENYDIVAGIFFLCAAPLDSDHFDYVELSLSTLNKAAVWKFISGHTVLNKGGRYNDHLSKQLGALL